MDIDDDGPGFDDEQFVSLEIGPRKIPMEVKRIAGQNQCHWALKPMIRALFPGTHEKKSRAAALPWSDVEDTHRLLWPNVKIPEKSACDDPLGNALSVGISTSVLFSFIVWGIRHQSGVLTANFWQKKYWQTLLHTLA